MKTSEADTIKAMCPKFDMIIDHNLQEVSNYLFWIINS